MGEKRELGGGGGDKVDFGIGLSYWPLSLGSLAGRYDNPMPELTLSPSQGLRNWASETLHGNEGVWIH